MTTSTAVDITDPQFVADPIAELGPRPRGGAAPPRDGPASQDEVWLVTRQEDVRAVLADPRVVTDPTKIAGAVEDVRAKTLLAIGVPEHLLHYLTGVDRQLRRRRPHAAAQARVPRVHGAPRRRAAPARRGRSPPSCSTG